MTLKFHFMCTLRGVSLHDVKNVLYMYLVGTMTKCLLIGGGCLQKVSFSGDSTIY